VELEQPTSYFTYLLTIPATYPVPRHLVETYGDAWAQATHIVTNGPFKLETWTHGESMILSRNPCYHGWFRGNVQQVELLFIPDPHAELEAYEADGLDILDFWGLPATEMERVRRRHASEYTSFPVPRTYYIGFNAGCPPFDDVRVRRAFVMATDREGLADATLRNFRLPATGGFVPPGMPGHSPRIGLLYDPVRARELLAEAGYPEGRGFPVVEALESSTSVYGAVTKHIEAQWREILGIEVAWKTLAYAKLRERIETRPPHLFILSWGAAYPDPDFFLRASPVRRDSRWRHDAYNHMVEQARMVLDQDARIALYKQADKLLIEEAVIMPLVYGRIHMLVKPWIRQLPTSTVKQWFWKDVIMERHPSSASR